MSADRMSDRPDEEGTRMFVRKDVPDEAIIVGEIAEAAMQEVRRLADEEGLRVECCIVAPNLGFASGEAVTGLAISLAPELNGGAVVRHLAMCVDQFVSAGGLDELG